MLFEAASWESTPRPLEFVLRSGHRGCLVPAEDAGLEAEPEAEVVQEAVHGAAVSNGGHNLLRYVLVHLALKEIMGPGVMPGTKGPVGTSAGNVSRR